jgi:2-polyprenyl-3-methyl-5-hydroxy-6-metoxy-1,4-benzoquinol methylase
MDAAGWDQRYDTAEFVWATEPNRFLPPEVEGLTPGRALDVACGEGRNAVWLATQGWDATGIDFSAVGLAKARQLAAERGVTVQTHCCDLRGESADRNSCSGGFRMRRYRLLK